MIVPIVPIASMFVQATGTFIGKHHRNDLDDRDDCDRLDN